MATRRYIDAEFADAVRTSTSIAAVLRALGLRPAGGNFANAKRTIQRLGLDTSHFTGRAWNRGERQKDWSDYSRAVNLKPHLLEKRGVQCELCQRETWLGAPIPLELHHQDGDRTNNELPNLRLLCPNCHALTDTWRNRKRVGDAARRPGVSYAPPPRPMPDRLRAHAQAVAPRSHAPYSGRPAGAAALLADGRWVAAPRLENASFPLTIPALQGALALAALAGGPVVAVAQSRPFGPAALGEIEDAAGGPWRLDAPDLAVAEAGGLPTVGEPARLTLNVPPPPDTRAGAALALDAASRAVVPASAFPVGAAVEDDEGRVVLGANVEVAGDWTRGLCAERTALVGARAAALGPIRRLYVACAKAPGGTPCGGCRQVIAELAPDCAVVIWRGADEPEITTPAALLPGAFDGRALGR